MSIVNIASQTDFSKVAGVFSDGSLRTKNAYTVATVNSATATGSIFTGAGILHAVMMNSSAVAPLFWLFDNADTASAAIIGASASAVVRYSGIPCASHIYNIIINSGLLYRLSAGAVDGINIIYSSSSVSS
jgi:hypothetical protein